MDDWAKVQSLGLEEMKNWPVGMKIRLRMLGGKLKGVIIEHENPIGLLSPRYKCRLESGDITGWLHRHDMIKD